VHHIPLIQKSAQSPRYFSKQDFLAVSSLLPGRVGMACYEILRSKSFSGEAGYVLEDVPHLTDYFPDLPVYISLFL
jgi:hypothetical protein